MARIVIGIAIGTAFVVAMVLATLREGQVSCELCVRFGGAEACRRATAADRSQALTMAQNTACAVLAGGVTRGMQCMRAVPHQVSCEGD
jgi:hypothetical protein